MAIDGAVGELAIGGNSEHLKFAIGGLPFHHHWRAFKPMQVDFGGGGLDGKRTVVGVSGEGCDNQ
jgi:hypothetical protein